MPFSQVSNLSHLAVRKAERVFRAHEFDVENKEKEHLDHDLVVSKSHTENRVEVKIDTIILNSGNVSAEWWVDEPNQQKGWAQTSEADLLVYFYDFDWPYVLRMPELRKYVSDHLDQLENGYVRFPDMVTDSVTGEKRRAKTVNKLVPIRAIPEIRVRDIEVIFGTPELPEVLGKEAKRVVKRILGGRTAAQRKLGEGRQ